MAVADPEQLNILKKGVKNWNKWRLDNPTKRFFLSGADLSGADLRVADLRGANLFRADLSRAYLSEADLREADLHMADLRGANLIRADLSGADLRRANFIGAELSKANLSEADLHMADLSDANFSDAHLSGADLSNANLFRANLDGANLSWARFNGVDLSRAKFQKAIIGSTEFVNVVLPNARDLISLKHRAPSTIGTDTLVKSKGSIPGAFLRQCGLSPWEIEFARLYDPALTPYEIAELLSVNVFGKRTQGPLFIGGIFLSYSHEDSEFVDKLYERLKNEGATVWLDRHDMVAGMIKRQVIKQIRILDVVIIVLSKSSVESDWVENELEIARKKEKEEKREVICPVALDDSWKAKIKGDPLWRQVAKYFVLDFSGSFDLQFKKLVNGIKKNYTIFNK
ncbi:MAG: toll/interleukin-1 receptor domain-containing protein [Pseudomonadota bacterium]